MYKFLTAATAAAFITGAIAAEAAPVELSLDVPSPFIDTFGSFTAGVWPVAHVEGFTINFDSDFTTGTPIGPGAFEFDFAPSFPNALSVSDIGGTVFSMHAGDRTTVAVLNDYLPSPTEVPSSLHHLLGLPYDVVAFETEFFPAPDLFFAGVGSVSLSVALVYDASTFGPGHTHLPMPPTLAVVGGLQECPLDIGGLPDCDAAVGGGLFEPIVSILPVEPPAEVPIGPALPMLGAGVLLLGALRRRST